MKYLLTIAYEFEADDDPAARSYAKKLLTTAEGLAEQEFPQIKLRCVYANRQPRSVDMK